MSAAIPTIPPGLVDVMVILADVARRGITLQAHGGKLRFRPRSAMTPELTHRIKSHKSALLALLTIPGGDTTSPMDTATGRDGAESGISSVVSVPERGALGSFLWSEDELAMLGRVGATPADLPLLSAVKEAFADFGATVVSVESSHGGRGWTRRWAAELIRDTRRQSASRAVAMRDAWAERLAVCTIDGGLSDDGAAQIALAELENMLH